MECEKTKLEVKCSICGQLFTADGMKDASCPNCGATVFDKDDANFDKWRKVPAIRVVGVK